jgi:predicted nicotinamide N-methyase
MSAIKDPLAFVRDNTRLQAPPHTPELVLHLADEVTPIWRLTEEELGAMGLPPPFWAFAWAGGQGVARFVLDHPEIARGKRVLDFASGSGLCAIAALKAGAASALAVDIDPFCAAAIALNAAANDVMVEARIEDLLDAPPPAEIDLFLAGDIAYEKPLAGKVRAWLAAARRTGAEVIIGDPGRTYFDAEGLEPLAEYRVPTTRELEDLEVKRTGVWRLS